MAVDSRFRERSGSGFGGGSASFKTAEAEEHCFDLLLELLHVFDFRCRDAPTAEQANVGECVEIRHGDLMRLHTTHG